MPKSARPLMVVVFAFTLSIIIFVASCLAQGVMPAPVASPSRPLGLPSAYGSPSGGDTIPLTSGMLTPYLPNIPNLEFGFQYFFGN